VALDLEPVENQAQKHSPHYCMETKKAELAEKMSQTKHFGGEMAEEKCAALTSPAQTKGLASYGKESGLFYFRDRSSETATLMPTAHVKHSPSLEPKRASCLESI